MNKNTGIEELFEMLEIEERGVKTVFHIAGLKFWFSKQRGMVRLRGAAQAVFDAQQADPRGVSAGEYDHLVEKLLQQAVFVPSEGDPMALAGAGYDAFLDHIEAIDETRALQVYTDMPVSLAIVCLGKPVLTKILTKAEGPETSTLLNSEADSPLSTPNTAEPAQSGTTSQTPAQGLTVGIPTTG